MPLLVQIQNHRHVLSTYRISTDLEEDVPPLSIDVPAASASALASRSQWALAFKRPAAVLHWRQ